MYCDGHLKFLSVSESCESVGPPLFSQVFLPVDLKVVLSSVVQVMRLQVCLIVLWGLFRRQLQSNEW